MDAPSERAPGAPDGGDPKVVFIIGKGRSGSTLLDNALGQLPGFFSAGEIWLRWRWMRLDRCRCSCGVGLVDCPVWSRALGWTTEQLSDELGSDDPLGDAAAAERSVLAWTNVPRILRTGTEDVRDWPELDLLVRTARVLYRALARAAGARVIVDSSKWPAHPALLGLVNGVRPYALHLIRDPRAVAFSWQRVKTYPGYGEPMDTFGPLNSSLSWIVRNATAELTARRLGDRALRLRYEDFVTGPRPAFRTILDMLDEPVAELPFENEQTLRLDPTHTVGGNPSRFVTGSVEVRNDDEWKRRLGRGACVATTLLTLPLLRRYGYALRVTGR